MRVVKVILMNHAVPSAPLSYPRFHYSRCASCSLVLLDTSSGSLPATTGRFRKIFSAQIAKDLRYIAGSHLTGDEPCS